MPKRYPLGLLKVLLTAIPFLYLGSLASKYAALGLEKMDLFVYSDDDDDDDDDWNPTRNRPIKIDRL